MASNTVDVVRLVSCIKRLASTFLRLPSSVIRGEYCRLHWLMKRAASSPLGFSLLFSMSSERLGSKLISIKSLTPFQEWLVGEPSLELLEGRPRLFCLGVES